MPPITSNIWHVQQYSHAATCHRCSYRAYYFVWESGVENGVMVCGAHIGPTIVQGVRREAPRGSRP